MEIQNKCIGRKSENVVPNQMQLHIQKKKKKGNYIHNTYFWENF